MDCYCSGTDTRDHRAIGLLPRQYEGDGKLLKLRNTDGYLNGCSKGWKQFVDHKWIKKLMDLIQRTFPQGLRYVGSDERALAAIPHFTAYCTT